MKFFNNILQSQAHIIFASLTILFWLVSLGPTWAMENFQQHISISITMIFGSFVAGGTALGGGAVAFPVLTKILGIIPPEAKLFSLAIQSFGMTAASLTIICRNIPFYPRVVFFSLLGAVPGTLISIIWISDLLPRLATKSLFSLFLLVFSMTLINFRKKRFLDSSSLEDNYLLVTIVGFVGGIASGLLGSGVDILLFALLILILKKDIKKATATSVIVMAVTSVLASTFNAVVLGNLTPQIQSYVHAAIPIVVIGAPLGAWICSNLKNHTVFNILLALIFLEISFTFFEIFKLFLTSATSY